MVMKLFEHLKTTLDEKTAHDAVHSLFSGMMLEMVLVGAPSLVRSSPIL